MDAKAQNWDDLRYFLAVAKTGSLSGAARRLGVNHSTVFRRIGAFETQLGVRLFERLPSGYLLTQAGEEMREGALRVEDEIASLSRKVTGQDLRLSGTIRVTTLDMLAFGLLPRHLANFRTVYPGIEVELIVGNVTLNLNRREADIALRVGNTPPETLVGRRVGQLVFAIYGSENYLAGKGGTGLEQHDWIGFDTEHAALTRRFSAFLPAAQPLLRTNSIAAAIAATKAGMGLAPLPCGLADLEPDLVHVAALPEDFTLDLWLLTHEDLRQTARIRAFLDFLAGELAREAPLLKGNGRAGPASSMQNHPMNAEARASATRR
ncbi:LysR family transcriptional regulator [Devosia sp. YIM 151766]|uniref:LysR family transcriptional regulator n=1 Tax=Devosia sp. YIM 151766 TaxID=3017325 RepID=UPI00255C7EC3|nr:LysR family transcriptional regulator [Devosia sp. YIM 151766]WIY52063.1 LysR family transcriptional regulator [Devosia sp. YIM 151766]